MDVLSLRSTTQIVVFFISGKLWPKRLCKKGVRCFVVVENKEDELKKKKNLISI